jgi:hypothetical protein
MLQKQQQLLPRQWRLENQQSPSPVVASEQMRMRQPFRDH